MKKTRKHISSGEMKIIMSESELLALQRDNADFRNYLCRLQKARGVEPEEAIKLKIVEYVALSYLGKLKVGDIVIDMSLQKKGKSGNIKK